MVVSIYIMEIANTTNEDDCSLRVVSSIQISMSPHKLIFQPGAGKPKQGWTRAKLPAAGVI